MKIGIVLQSNSPERVWNTFRFALTSLKASHSVSIFLMSEGSELDGIQDTEHFDISKKVSEFKELSGVLYACGTCIKLRGKEDAGVCPISTMSDLLTIVEESDKVLVF
ncbi:MAG: DsrE family protein [Parcubacteria group bacterium GW2011_GWD2_42_14]|uniref:DsrE family protein n=1 Tax=Candidatus Magasanikbacteria bacterium GW2011_GWE2_42_7 TaxID=1619052 RepID=A0A0G1DI14_9BACT|nr:MAG: DsrE family protein [Parcubacteria group bacterium GW2011_GWD2_42_14]KKS70456.1 MAG: DsrE family protein [Candidatus Magasanikbacteria bacterium GW2011_GWE2_42_7]